MNTQETFISHLVELRDRLIRALASTPLPAAPGTIQRIGRSGLAARVPGLARAASSAAAVRHTFPRNCNISWRPV